ncbi:hypothetical protein ABA31_20920 [Agrococcus baldri]|uniref:DUF559 domain-containing protein n=2 Tax=Agrococcus baldri TaxID=153730 RepID=A0AA87RI35_9MICO|nr:hypothetical protein ABA31_20920 [Agrococcus baldri]
MSDGWALPAALQGGVFTATDAAELGVGARRLRSDRVEQLHHGVWADASAELGIVDRSRAALLAVGPDAWISHATAAHLHELWLPPRLRELDRIDATMPAPMHAPRGSGLRGRQRVQDETQLMLLDGIRVTTPAQTFVDATDVLSLADLVALGDSVVQQRQPRAAAGELREAIDAHRGRRGHRRLLAAAQLVSPQSRSASETIARLELRALGDPPVWWNVPVVLDGIELAPDAAIWPAGLVIEVEGDHHRVDREQWVTDIDRYNLYQRLDLEPHRLLVTTRAETRERLRAILDRVRQRWDPERRPPPIADWCDEPPTVEDGWLLAD